MGQGWFYLSPSGSILKNINNHHYHNNAALSNGVAAESFRIGFIVCGYDHNIACCGHWRCQH